MLVAERVREEPGAVGVITVMGGTHVVAEFVGKGEVADGRPAVADVKGAAGKAGALGGVQPAEAGGVIAAADPQADKVGTILVAQGVYVVHEAVGEVGEAVKVRGDVAGFGIGHLAGVGQTEALRDAAIGISLIGQGHAFANQSLRLGLTAEGRAGGRGVDHHHVDHTAVIGQRRFGEGKRGGQAGSLAGSERIVIGFLDRRWVELLQIELATLRHHFEDAAIAQEEMSGDDVVVMHHDGGAIRVALNAAGPASGSAILGEVGVPETDGASGTIEEREQYPQRLGVFQLGESPRVRLVEEVDIHVESLEALHFPAGGSRGELGASGLRAVGGHGRCFLGVQPCAV